MKLSDLERASDWDVKQWLEKELQLTPYQRSRFDSETVRMSPLYFYKAPKREKTSVWWRITIFFFVIYCILAFIFLPVKWMFTAKWGYSRNFYDNFHAKWKRKIGI